MDIPWGWVRVQAGLSGKPWSVVVYLEELCGQRVNEWGGVGKNKACVILKQKGTLNPQTAGATGRSVRIPEPFQWAVTKHS